MEDFKKLANRKWYNQRFDGSPMFMSMIAYAETKIEPRKPKGTEATWRVGFFDGSRSDWFLDQEDIDRGAKIIMDLAESPGDLSAELMEKWKEDECLFDEFFNSVVDRSYESFSDQGLVDEFEKYHQLAVNRFTSSAIIDHFALGTDTIIADLIRKEMGPFKKESEFNDIFSKLTAPVHQSFINDAEIELLKIAILIKNGKNIDSDEIKKLLEEHQKKYFWIQNNYVKSYIVSMKEFIKEIKIWLKSGKDLNNQVRFLVNTPLKNKTNKAKLLKKLSSHLRKLLKISEDFTRWQDERKRATYLSTFIGSKILGEMSERRQIDLELLKYLLPYEVSDWFLSNKIDEKVLAKRKIKCAVVWGQKDKVAYIGDAVDQLHRLIVEQPSFHDVQDIRGLVANTGRAVGKVKIVMSAEEIGKVKEGDILVAVMTRPDYVPAMKKAAAIVTDEGGITSHAAIVSRELGKPCIIGTKIATKIFKEGELIEVNANHNWARKVK